MPLENSAGIKVLTNYGVRTTEGKFGAVIGNTGNATRKVVFDIDFGDLNSLTAATKTGLDMVFPTGTKFLRSQLTGKTTFVGPTEVTVSTYTFVEATGAVTVVALGNIHTAAATAVATFAANSSVAGTGASLGNGAFVTTTPVIVRILPTVAVATAGKARLTIEYLVPAP